MMQHEEENDSGDKPNSRKESAAPVHRSDPMDFEIFDRRTLTIRMMEDEDLVAMIISGFLEDMPTQIGTLRTMVADGKSGEAATQAHKIKGAAANISSTALQNAAAAMEQAGKAGDLDQLVELMPKLEHRFIQLKSILEAS